VRLPQKYQISLTKHKLIVNLPLITQKNRLHAGQQNSKSNKSIPFTLRHIQLHALTEVILEFYE